jgi:hypothetical protein
MQRYGDDDAGFSILPDTGGGVRVVGWGFWTAELAHSFDKAVLSACRQVNAGRLTLDMGQLKPMREEGQQAFASLFSMLKLVGVAEASVRTESHLTKLQLLRIARESGPKDSVQFV